MEKKNSDKIDPADRTDQECRHARLHQLEIVRAAVTARASRVREVNQQTLAMSATGNITLYQDDLKALVKEAMEQAVTAVQ